MPNKFELTVLGTNSSYPSNNRMLSAQILKLGGQMYLIDCGEGTQMQLSQFRVKRSHISVIFISHLHGDHVFGLPGLISSFNHFERTKPLFIFGPKGIKEMLTTVLKISEARIDFKIKIIETDTETSSLIYEDKRIEVYNFPMRHRIPTQGFSFVEKTPYFPIITSKIEEYDLSYEDIRALKDGESITNNNGEIITPDMACLPKPKARKYSYMSDTSYLNPAPDIIRNSDLLYHETTYLEDLAEMAFERGHSTTTEAAKTALDSGAKKLLVGHYSSRYNDLSLFELECKKTFENSHVAVEGGIYEIK